MQNCFSEGGNELWDEQQERSAVDELEDSLFVDLPHRILSRTEIHAMPLVLLSRSELNEFERAAGHPLSDCSRGDLSETWLRFYVSLLSARPPPREELMHHLSNLANSSDEIDWATLSLAAGASAEDHLNPRQIALRFFARLVNGNFANVERARLACLSMKEALQERPIIFEIKKNPRMRFFFRAVCVIAAREGLSSALPSNGEKSGKETRKTPLYVFGTCFFESSVQWAKRRLDELPDHFETREIIAHAKRLLKNYEFKGGGAVLDYLRTARNDRIALPGRLGVDVLRSEGMAPPNK